MSTAPLLPELAAPAPWWRARRTLFLLRIGLNLAGAVIVVSVISSLAGGVAESFDTFLDASPPWIVAAVVAETVCYCCIAIQLGRLLRGGGTIGRFVPFELGLLLYGVGSLMPGSPAPGLAIATVELRRRGMDAARMTAALLWNSWFNVRAFLILGIFTGTVGVLRGRIPTRIQDTVVVAVIAVSAGLIVSSMIVMRASLVERIAQFSARVRLGRFRPFPASSAEIAARWHLTAMESLGSQHDRSVITFAALASWVFDAICLRFALIAVGVHVHMAILLIAYVASMLVSQIPWVPGGIGLVEATVPAVLHHYHVPLDDALAGTLAWRAIALLLPALAGIVAIALLRAETVRIEDLPAPSAESSA